MTSRLKLILGAATAVVAAIAVGFFLKTGPIAEPSRAFAVEVPALVSDEHTMFGGTPGRNFVNLRATGLSAEFPKDAEGKSHVLGSRVKWKAPLGSRAYGGPSVAGGRIYVGTNNDTPRNDRDRGKPNEDDPKGPAVDKGVIMCFNEKTGDLLWQAVHDKLEAGQVWDYPLQGICSTPFVEGDRIYYVSNRCEVVCADVNGFANGNDGFQKEKYQDKTDADFIWVYDMIKELKVFPHNLAACSPLIIGDLLFIVTANGVDEGHVNIPFPEAPSFICLNKKTGKLLWKSSLPGKNIMHGQWSNPTYAVLGGKAQVIFPGGDGWIYGLEPETGKLIWKFDANPKDSKYELGNRGTKSDFIATPVVYDGRIYIGTGQDPDHGQSVAHFWCFAPTMEGDVSLELVTDATATPPATKPNPNSAVVWHYGGERDTPFAQRNYAFGRTMSTACIVDDVVYISELAGYVHCLDAKTGKKFWQFDTKSEVWGSCYFADGKVLIGTADGDLYIFKHMKEHEVMDEVAVGTAAAQAAEKEATATGKDESAIRKATRDAYRTAAMKVHSQVAAKYLLQKVEINETIRSTPVVANGVIYVMSERNLYALNAK